MAAKAYGPADASSLTNNLTHAAINAYMATTAAKAMHLTYEEGCCADGYFRYKDDEGSWTPDGHYKVTYPGGKWSQDIHWPLPDEHLSPGQTNHIIHDGTPLALIDAAAAYSDIESQVLAWLMPWYDCDHPGNFTGQMTKLRTILGELDVSDDDDVIGMSSNLGSAIDDLDTFLPPNPHPLSLQGRAIDALKVGYVNDIEKTFGGQRRLAYGAQLALLGEATAWNNAYKGVHDFVAKATIDFNSLAGIEPPSGHDINAGLTAASGVATVLSGIASGTAEAAGDAAEVPIAAAGLCIVAGLATVASTFFGKDQPKPPPKPNVLTGSDFSSYFASFTKGISKISDDLAHAETIVATGCQNVLDDYHRFPDKYSITGKTGMGQMPDDSLKPFMTPAININHYDMKRVAGAIAAIGDHQNKTAGDLTAVPDAVPWMRECLPSGVIGKSFNGSFDVYDQVITQLAELLRGECQTAHRVADRCMDIAYDFKDTDRQIRDLVNKAAKASGYDRDLV